MNNEIKVIFLCAVFVLLLRLQFNLDADQTAKRYLKNAAELAVHDAALSLDLEELGEGKIVFVKDIDDPLAVQNVIKRSLQANLQLTGSLQPTEDSFFKKPILIKELMIFDDETVDPSMYPMDYPGFYDVDINGVLNKKMYGPTIVMVVETESPRPFSTTTTKITQAAAYEYKPY